MALQMMEIVRVSILVLMDFRLKDLCCRFKAASSGGFNPCSNGLSAQSGERPLGSGHNGLVSILVLMDFRLKES